MHINTATFVKSAIGTDDIFADGKPQIVFIGRSNAGKSSAINSLANQKNLARTSSLPGKTQQMNIFLINESVYLVDLPGYGFAKRSREDREQLEKMINWYLFKSPYEHKLIVLIIDANVGPTELDLEMLYALRADNKNFLVLANKIDKIKPSQYKTQMDKIAAQIGNHRIIPYSSEKKVGVGELTDAILS